MIKQFVCILGSWTRIQNVNVTITSIRSSRFLTTTISNNSSNTGASTVTSSRAASVPVATIHPMDNAKMQRLFHHNIEVPTAMDLRVIAERQLESNVDGIIGKLF